MTEQTTARRAVDRDILNLAVPALGALVAEPLFLLADTAMVGHLGAIPLAGLGIASAVLQTIIGLMVFLAYSTTPAVARAVGDGQFAKALAAGRDGVWLLLLLGIGLAATNPRRASNWNLLFALLAFGIYFNLINLSQAWIASGRMHFGPMMLLLHGGGLALALALIWWRDNGASLLTGHRKATA